MRIESAQDVQFSYCHEPSTCFTANFNCQTTEESRFNSNMPSLNHRYSIVSVEDYDAVSTFEETPVQKVQTDWNNLSNAPRKDHQFRNHYFQTSGFENQWQTPSTSNQQSRLRLESVLQVKESAEKERNLNQGARVQFELSQSLSQILS